MMGGSRVVGVVEQWRGFGRQFGEPRLDKLLLKVAHDVSIQQHLDLGKHLLLWGSIILLSFVAASGNGSMLSCAYRVRGSSRC